MIEEAILNEIEENRDEYVQFLKELVQADSYNPPGNEKNVAEIAKRFLEKHSVKVEMFEFGENRANILAYLSEKFDQINLLYNSHMDVVPPGVESEWKYKPLSAEIKRKKVLFGRGSTDAKGPLAAMLIALAVLKRLDIKPKGNLIVNAVADEETGGKYGTGWCLDNILKKRNIKCDFAVIGEPSGLKPLPKAIVVGEKGHLIVKVITNGISGHSMTPFMYKNAITMMSEIIQSLDQLEEFIPKIDPPFSIEKLKELLSSAFPSEEIFERILSEQPLLQGLLKSLTEFTKSLNVIHGGIKENIVPDQCEALIDFRLYPGQIAEMIIDGLTKLINTLGYEVRETPTGDPEDIFVYVGIHHQGEASIWRDFEDSKVTKDFQEILERIYNTKSFFILAPGSTDAHYYRNTNFCPQTIHFGPGNAGGMHITNENIELLDFINAIKVYTLFAYKYLLE